MNVSSVLSTLIPGYRINQDAVRVRNVWLHLAPDLVELDLEPGNFRKFRTLICTIYVCLRTVTESTLD